MTHSTYHHRTRQLLIMPAVGASPRELEALRLPPIHVLPNIPSGHGLVGPTGTGKTFALVRLAADLVEQVVQANPCPAQANMPQERSVKWLNWPEWAEQLKRTARDQESTATLVERWKEARTLFLDDLGRERVKDKNDYSLAILDEVIDARYRYLLPTYWTSNLSPAELAEFYPSRLASRLLATWPPQVIEGEDLRLKKLLAVQDFKRAASGDV